MEIDTYIYILPCLGVEKSVLVLYYWIGLVLYIHHAMRGLAFHLGPSIGDVCVLIVYAAFLCFVVTL